jgi:hypothetical protein
LARDNSIKHGNARVEEAVEGGLTLLNKSAEGKRIVDVRDLNGSHDRLWLGV